MPVIFLTTTGANNWTVPADWNNADNSIECIGGGAAGSNESADAGGSGGGYSKSVNVALTPSSSIPYSVAPTAGAGLSGDATWFGHASYGSAIVGAKGGRRPESFGIGAPGGKAAEGIGSVKYSGGKGGNAGGYAGGGGGAASRYGDGRAGGDGGSGTTGGGGGSAGGGSDGGNGGATAGDPGGMGGNNNNGTDGGGNNPPTSGAARNGFVGAGGGGGYSGSTTAGAGAPGREYQQTSDSAYAGAGGGGGAEYSGGAPGGLGGLYGGGGGSRRGATGAQGLIVITYTPAGGDTTAPILSDPTGTQTGSTTATIGATTDEANGTLYGYVSTSATPPSDADLKAGTGAAWAGSASVSSTGVNTLNATGLTAGTGYYAHLLHTDAAANDSNIVTSAQFTTAAASSGVVSKILQQMGL